MDPTEYLAFIPLLFYGIALADLLGQWRRFFDPSYRYLPYVITTIVFTEVAVWNVYAYLEVLPNLKSAGYVQYWAYMVQPMLFLLTVSALTPEAEDQDTEDYFKRRMPIVFGLMAVFIFSHLFSGFGASVPVTVPRVIAIGLCIAIAATRKIALVYVMAAVWVLTLVARV